MISKRILTIIIGVSIWEILAYVARTRSFPHSWSVLGDLLSLMQMLSFWSSLAVTLWLSFSGLALGACIALTLGISIGVSKAVELSVRGVLDFFRCIPSIVLLPLLVALIGSSASTVVILTSFVVAFKLVIYVIRGIQDTSPQLLEGAAAMRMPWSLKILYIYLPSTISIVGTGLRLSASRAFGTVVAAGIVAGTPGLGSKLMLAEEAAQYSRIFSYIFVMGLVGTLIYAGFSAFERRFFVWRVTA